MSKLCDSQILVGLAHTSYHWCFGIYQIPSLCVMECKIMVPTIDLDLHMTLPWDPGDGQLCRSYHSLWICHQRAEISVKPSIIVYNSYICWAVLRTFMLAAWCPCNRSAHIKLLSRNDICLLPNGQLMPWVPTWWSGVHLCFLIWVDWIWRATASKLNTLCGEFDPCQQLLQAKMVASAGCTCLQLADKTL